VSWLHFFLVFILLALAIFLVLHVTSRYAVQLLPMWIVFAAAALYAGWVWQRTRRLPMLAGFVASRARLGVGIAWGLLLLFLAFRNLLA
jgi:hypothetical protein